MIVLSEYKENNRYATVCYRADLGDFVGIGYIDNLERSAHPFASEEAAENWCEDWVLGVIS
jgi:hypothetical protein